jgi:hypothetical protein
MVALMKAANAMKATKAAKKVSDSAIWPPSMLPQQFYVLLLRKAQGGQIEKGASYEGGQTPICWTARLG